MSLTPLQRAAAYSVAFPDYPPLFADARWLHGIWIMGQNYRSRSGFYGSYPPGYLTRVLSLFDDYRDECVLHPFAGSLTADPHPDFGPACRVDLNPERQADFTADVTAMPFDDGEFSLALADPPYTEKEAKEQYGVPMVDRRKALREVARVVRKGGQIVWLDTMFPMFSKELLHWWGMVGMVRSTNHRVRGVFMFERV